MFNFSYFIIIIINCEWVCTRWQWYYNTQNNTYTHSKKYTAHKITNIIQHSNTENTKHTKNDTTVMEVTIS
jgi:hypothetical protein